MVHSVSGLIADLELTADFDIIFVTKWYKVLKDMMVLQNRHNRVIELSYWFPSVNHLGTS